MSERLGNHREEMCASCPNRGRVSRLLARAAHKSETTDECDGVVEVSRGIIFTQIREHGESAPPQETWARMTGSASFGNGPRRYDRTDWTETDVCGKEPIVPNPGEINAYVFDDEIIHTDDDNKRYAKFIRGTKQQIHDYTTTQALSFIDGEDPKPDA